jgi:hypothetical protein
MLHIVMWVKALSFMFFSVCCIIVAIVVKGPEAFTFLLLASVWSGLGAIVIISGAALKKLKDRQDLLDRKLQELEKKQAGNATVVIATN